MKSVPYSRHLVFLAIASVGFLCDLLSKNWIFQRLGMPGGDILWIWEPYFGLQTSTNRGALFGFGQGNVWLFATASFVAILSVTYWLFIAGAARDWFLNVALALVMGGVLGNLYDRMGLWTVPDVPHVRMHAVRDWILFQWGTWVWPNFNIADSLLVCGGGLLVWHAMTHAAPLHDHHGEAAGRQA